MTDKSFFGNKEINKEQRQNLVNEVFSSVASKYDIMNDVMSFGIHRCWKNALMNELPNINGKLLDVAGGTADIALRFANKAKKNNKIADITVCDINPEMLEVGKAKAIDNNHLNIQFIEGNAEKLPFDDNSFDYYTIAFGIRNVTNIDKAVREAYRVLKPGGKFICMEFSQVQNSFLKQIYDFYSHNFIPKFGKLIAGDEESYTYLVESIRKFPNQESFKNLIENENFQQVSYKNFNNGIVALHKAFKI